MKGWNIVIEAAAKRRTAGAAGFPVDRKIRLRPAGDAAALRRAPRVADVSASGVYYDGSTSITPTDPQIVPTLVVGYERKLSPKTHLILQGYVSDSIYIARGHGPARASGPEIPV